MRNLFRTILGAVTGAVMAASAAQAAVHTYDLGSLPAGDTAFTGVTGAGSFTDYIKFQLPFAGAFTVSYSDSAGAGKIVGGQLALYACLSNCAGESVSLLPLGTLIDSAPLVSLGALRFGGFGPDLLVAAEYFLKLTGVAPSGSVGFAGTITVASAVPEPETWAMMLVGFAGLAFVTGRRRKTAVALA
ncbi:MAG: hypothetical protein BGP06_14830 [Rhizobiales bacterium 65-9]|nr:FxDxF family PEP-CTERM protein [Hyphomicrobiales bacterium]OJY38274.1 MAG: hypothetical protein BGP06_14830 [Rhizobiales bacterium 65-9]